MKQLTPDQFKEYMLNPLAADEKVRKWCGLEQQVTELTQANEYLRNQLANISPVQNSRNNNSDVILEDTESNVKVNVVNLFLEIQTAYMNVGFNYNNGIPKSNLIIHPEAFINRLLNFFPFLEEYRKIQLP